MFGRLWTLLPLVVGIVLALLTGLWQAGRVTLMAMLDGRIDGGEQATAEKAALRPLWAALRRFTPIEVD